MFGMGMTMSVHDFALVLKRPKDVFFGACAQYLVMPFLAYVLSTLFHLDPALTVGVVLVGTCPGGTSSNVITFMSKGDVPLSVTMTSVSTLISPIMTPLLTYLIIGQRISFDPVGMFLSILQIVIVPIALGLVVKSFLPKLADTATDYLPAVSSLAISFLIAGIIGASRDAILNSSGIILLVVILHNCLGYALGFFIGHLCGMSWKKWSPCPSKSACRTPVWLRAWQKLTLPRCPWLAYPVLSSVHGITFPAPSWLIFTSTI